MRSTKVQAARNWYGQLYNALRADAEAATWLLPHQQTGYYSLGTNAANGQTATFTVNGTAIVVTLVTSIGTTPNNVLIGASAAATVVNIFNFLKSPNVTTSTQVAAVAANCQLLSYVEWKQVGTAITACSLNNDTYAPLTSFSGSTTVTSGTYTAQAMQLFVEKGQFLLGGARVAFAGGSSPTITAPVSHPRIDLLTINSSGTLSLVTGTENVSPSVPAYPANVITLCEIYNVVGETSINDNANQISGQGYIQYDVRSILQNTDSKVSQSMAQISGTDTGGANAYAIAPNPAYATLSPGMVFAFIIAHGNTGSSTLAVSSLAATAIRKYGTQALASGDMPAGGTAVLQWDGTYFQLVNPATANTPPQGFTYLGGGYYGSSTNLATYYQFGANQNGLSGTAQVSSENSTATGPVPTNVPQLQLTYDPVANAPALGGPLWSIKTSNTPLTSNGAMLSQVPYAPTLFYVFGNNGGAYTGSYFISGSYFNAVTFAGSPPAPTTGVFPAAFTDGTYVYIAQSAGVYSKFSVSGTVLTYVTTVTYTGMVANSFPWTDGTSVYGYTSSGIAKWALAGGSATQYSGTSIGSASTSFVVGVSQTSVWLAVVSCNNVTASSGGVSFSTIATTVTYIPKF